MATTKRIVIESSAVPCVVNITTPNQEAAFNSLIGCSSHIKSGSSYIRMEVIRAWLGAATELACYVDMHGSLSHALKLLSQSFQIRLVKRVMDVVAIYLESGRPDSRAAAEEIARIGVGIIRMYDRRVKDRIANKSGCVLGNRRLEIDFNELVASCRDFITSFGGLQPCKVRDLLNGDGNRSGVNALASLVGTIDTVDKAFRLTNEDVPIDCRKCASVGDVVIALEQPRATILAHVDNAFKPLCECLGRHHLEIPSRIRAEHSDG